jgi:serine/threonine protein kinase
MAPERFTTGQIDPLADVYALTCVLHECLTGSQPFGAETYEQQVTAHMFAPVPQPSRLHGAVPPPLDRVIATGMAKDPAQRYQTTKELAAAARAALTSVRPAAPAVSRPSQPGPPLPLHPGQPAPRAAQPPVPSQPIQPAQPTAPIPQQPPAPLPASVQPAYAPPVQPAFAPPVMQSGGVSPHAPTGVAPSVPLSQTPQGLGYPPPGVWPPVQPHRRSWWQRGWFVIPTVIILALTTAVVVFVLTRDRAAKEVTYGDPRPNCRSPSMGPLAWRWIPTATCT